MSAARNILIASGRRLSQQQRSATLSYGGQDIPCTPGNLDFFEQLNESGSGFKQIRNLFVTILRSDLPLVVVAGESQPMEFKRGETVTVVDNDSGDSITLKVGSNNSKQSAIIQLNLQTSAI